MKAKPTTNLMAQCTDIDGRLAALFGDNENEAPVLFGDQAYSTGFIRVPVIVKTYDSIPGFP
jgi:hypothetical protein